jgi:hypothetical protein
MPVSTESTREAPVPAMRRAGQPLFWPLLATAVFSAVAAGCGSGQSDASGVDAAAPIPDAGLTYESFNAAVGEAICSALQGCCQVTVTDCLTRMEQSSFTQPLEGVGTRLHFDPVAAERCLPFYQQVIGACGYRTVSPETYGAGAVACKMTVRGAVLTGGDCTSSNECASSSDSAAECERSADAGHCMQTPWLVQGASCMTHSTACGSGLYCALAGGQVCEAPLPTGASCSGATVCASGYCRGTCRTPDDALMCADLKAILGMP